MANRPWVTPTEVRTYSENEAVQIRTDARLSVDITRAEQYVINYTRNQFADMDEIPIAVKTAVIILAEVYARNAMISAKDVKSETFDDYSYTVADSITNIADLGLQSLLDGFVLPEIQKSIMMRMRKL